MNSKNLKKKFLSIKSIDNVQLIKPDTASSMLNVTERTLYRYCKKGLPYYKIGKQYRFKIEDIIKFKNDNNL